MATAYEFENRLLKLHQMPRLPQMLKFPPVFWHWLPNTAQVKRLGSLKMNPHAFKCGHTVYKKEKKK